MTGSDALRAGVGVVLRRPASVLPLYLLATGALLAARVPLVVGVATAIGVLALRGDLQRIVDEAAAIDPAELGQGSPPPPELGRAVQSALTPDVVALVLLSLGAFLALLVVARAVTAAGTLNAVYAALPGGTRNSPSPSDPLTAGVAGIARDWTTFVGVAVLKAVASLVALVPVGVAVAVATPTTGGVLVVALGGVLSVSLLVVVLLLVAFTGQAIVVEGQGIVGAIRRSVGFGVRRPGGFALYLLVALGVTVGVGGVSLVGAGVGTPQLVSVVTVVAVSPALDAFKTALYADVGPPAGRAPARSEVMSALRGGWHRLATFVVGHPGANALSLLLFGIGALGGWSLTAGFGVRVPTPTDVASIFGGVAAVGTFVNLAANNWLVAVAGSFAGLALGVPTATNLLVNGAVVGAVAGVFDPLAIVVLVGPHGVLEVPALVVSGGLGFHLARVGWEWIRGRRAPADVGDELRVAAEVLVGLALVLVVAAFVEAFVTPQVADLVLGG
ncbi:MAG: stage II sporulation protein M [Halobacteriota archaeon]